MSPDSVRNGALGLYEAEGKCKAKADHSRSHVIQAIELVWGRYYLQATQHVRYKNLFKSLSIIHCRRRDLNTAPYFMLPSSICCRFRLCCARCLRRRRNRHQVPTSPLTYSLLTPCTTFRVYYPTYPHCAILSQHLYAIDVFLGGVHNRLGESSYNSLLGVVSETQPHECACIPLKMRARRQTSAAVLSDPTLPSYNQYQATLPLETGN